MKFTFNKIEYELLVLHAAGSRLYGNSRPESDWDYRGIMVASNKSKLGLLEKVDQLGGETGIGKSGEQLYKALVAAGLSLEETDDVCIYEVNRFVKLAMDNNPNIMDTLCFDYKAPTAHIVYLNDIGRKFLDSRDLFISKKLKFTFSGYAIAQLKKIKNHNKWIEQFPDTSKVISILKESVSEKMIDFDFIVQNFGGPLAEEITGETAQDHKTLEKCQSWAEFKMWNTKEFNLLDKYRIPRLYDFTKAFDLKAKVLDKDEEVNYVTNKTTNIETSIIHKSSIKDLLLHGGSFRQLGGSILSLFTDGTGIFDLGGNVKNHPPKEVGEFICVVILDKNEYKKHTDLINNMWNWKISRNKDRSVLEDKFGYDTKHASHLVRLMVGATKILTEHKFTPELSGDDLQLVKDVRAGKYTYDWVVKYSEELDYNLNELYKTSSLKNSPDIKKINKLLLEVIL